MPRLKPKAIDISIIGFMVMQNGNVIKKTWILLDTCYTDSVTKHLDHVEDVNNGDKDKEITVLIHGGLLIVDRKGRYFFPF